ncbi:MAG: GAF domain-containing sensor histidine kinase [Chloroflexi bacterium]|nr:GAF domain-containing sensor histidine kinase [Chloroflexota bacterium]MCI0574668.1 GAF domain-containing sensor histidine kinase [Chloroflexota bacterium]MCI0649050.1 GAF domain-containing sensor histidine kinase [Chloroflexota bacterium]MCI0725157.1 GAF domain-containing sensor histidine kinase [Chloroflexota bacterium]
MADVRTPNLADLTRQQESLRAVIESISSELELRPLLTRIVQHACELLGADRGTIGLVDEERNLIRTEAAYRMPPGEIGSEMSPGMGLAGRVLQTPQPVILNQYGDLERPILPELVQDAVIGLPIFWHDRLIGFFGIGAEPPRTFNDQDVELLALLARHAAIAIENARLFEAEKRRAARIATISRVGQRIAARLDPNELFAATVEELHQRLGYDHVSLFLVDPADPAWLVQRARASRWSRGEAVGYRQSIEEGILGATARERVAQVINDVSTDPRYVAVPGAEGLRAELALPILLGERLLGVLDVAGMRRFNQEDLTALQIVADQLAVAIDNAQLFAHTQHALEETQLLYKTSEGISTAMDVEGVIGVYLDQVATRGRYACSIVLYEFNETGERMAVLVRGRWAPDEGLALLNERLPYSRDALDPLLDAGETVAIANVYSDPRVSEELREIQRQSRRPALAMIPLVARGQRIGLVVLSYPAVRRWQSEDLRPYQATAAQLATAIDSRRQQSVLHERSQQLAVLEERQRLARELHDSVTQLIFSITLIAQSIAPAWRRNPAEAERRVGRLLELSQSALAEMRALLAELRPSTLPQVTAPTPGLLRLQQEGLAVALCHYATEIAGDNLEISVDTASYPAAGATGRPPLAHEEALYRIAQEALNNVVKHARAGRVQITLRLENGVVRLMVSDNGRGFASPAGESQALPTRPGGLGLKTMRERAEALGGQFQLTSAPGGGTVVEVFIPR